MDEHRLRALDKRIGGHAQVKGQAPIGEEYFGRPWVVATHVVPERLSGRKLADRQRAEELDLRDCVTDTRLCSRSESVGERRSRAGELEIQPMVDKVRDRWVGGSTWPALAVSDLECNAGACWWCAT